jgi:hypothetical protein
MFKSKTSAMFVVAALCGYLALMTPDWKSELQARSGAYSSGLDSADLTGEFFLYDAAAGQTNVWQIVDHSRDSVASSLYTNPAWSALGLGDFDADGTDDVFWFKTSTGEQTVWVMDAGVRESNNPLNAFGAAGYVFEGLGDFDGDGDADIFYRKDATGQTRIWQIDGSTVSREAQVYTPATALQVIAIGDVDSDGTDDIIWRKSDGTVQIWIMDANDRESTLYLPYMNLAYDLAGNGDYDGDGDVDLYWRNYSTGQNTVWLLGPTGRDSVVYNPALSTTIGYDLVNSVDTDGDGDDDVVWRKASTGQHRIFVMEDGDRFDTSFDMQAAATKFAHVAEQ